MISTLEAMLLTKEKVGYELKKGGSAFSDVFSLLSKGQGKFLRTRLGLICSADKRGRVDEKIISRLSALELLHLATLIHDDIIDSAETRRGLPSVQAAFGKHGAVIAGDYLLTRCFSILSNESSEMLSMFARAVSAVCRGEMLQERSLFNRRVTPFHYIKTVSGKTAALFSAAAVTGKNDYAHLSLGHKFGIIYQIYDDIRDFTGSSSSFEGKPFSKDLSSGVITLPAIYCLLKNPNLSDDGILQDIEYGIEQSKMVAESYFNKTKTLSQRAGINQTCDLFDLIKKIMQ